MDVNRQSGQLESATEINIPVAGGTLFCRIQPQNQSQNQLQNQPGRPPLLLLHGWPLDHRVWQPQVAHFADHYMVIALDRRGFGRSTGLADAGDAVADVDAVLDACGVESAVLVGMSRGGRIALRYAHERAERVRGLVLTGTAVDGFSPPSDAAQDIPIERYAALARAGELAALREAWRTHPLMELRGVGDDTVRLIGEMLADYNGQDLLAPSALQNPPPNVAAHLDRMRQPVLILTGEYETAARKAIAAFLAGGLPNAQSMVIANGGHLLNLEQPDQFNAAVDAFLKRHDLDN